MACCKDCPDRAPHCHGKCERYLKERAELDALNEKIRKDRLVEDYYRTTTSHALGDLAKRRIVKNRFEKGHDC